LLPGGRCDQPVGGGCGQPEAPRWIVGWQVQGNTGYDPGQ
jgi:hypothetical protein